MSNKYGLRAFSLFCVGLGLCAQAAFAGGRAELVNEQTFSLDGITAIAISYGSGKLVFLEGEDGELSVKEYMASDNENYFARPRVSDGILSIESGKRPWFRHLRARLEVYLPRSFEGACRVSMGSGSIEADTDIAAAQVHISAASGTMRLRNVSANRIRLRAASGSIYAGSLAGETDIELQSGSLRLDALEGGEHRVRLASGSANIGAASGAGAFSAASGSITLHMAALSGDLSFDLSSGSLRLALPPGAACNLDAETASGSISVESDDGGYTLKNRGSVLRPIGDNPEYTIRARVASGSIRITR